MSKSEKYRNLFHPNDPILTTPAEMDAVHTLMNAGMIFHKETIGMAVRYRDVYAAALVDRNCLQAFDAVWKAETPENIEILREELAMVLASNIADGKHPIGKDGVLDIRAARKIKLSASPAIQLRELAVVTKDDKFLELFSGAGNGTFIFSLMQPKELVSVDLYTLDMYRLDETQLKTHQWIYDDVKGLNPKYTPARFEQANAIDLPDSIDTDFTVIVDHPPFGRESMNVTGMKEINELDAFVLWIKTLNHVANRQTVRFRSYSVVPAEWAEVLEELLEVQDVDEKYTNEAKNLLIEKLHENNYYKGKRIPTEFTEPDTSIPKVRNLKLGRIRLVQDTKLFDLVIVEAFNIKPRIAA